MLKIFTLLYKLISRNFLSYKTKTLHSLNNCLFLLPKAHGSQGSSFYFYEFAYFYEFYKRAIMQCSSFCDWIVSLSIISSRFIHVIVCVRIFFLFKAEKYSIVGHAPFLFISSSIDGHLDYVHLLTIENSAAINMSVQIFVQDPHFIIFGNIF